MGKMTHLVFDLDGTIIKNGNRLSDESSHCFYALFQKYHIVFASARPVRDMLPLIPDDFHHATFIGCNGGQAWQDGQLIYSNHFSPEDVEAMVVFLKEQNIPYILDSDWHYACSNIKHDFHDYLRSLSTNEVTEGELLNRGITKILVLDGNSQRAFEEALSVNTLPIKKSPINEWSIHQHTNDNFFDITPTRTNKAEALLTLDFAPSHTLAVGNDHNDFTMLKQSKVSIFVGGEAVFSDANYYCDMDNLFLVLNKVLNLDYKKI